MNVAFGDHQVTNFQADVRRGRSAPPTREPVLYPGRWPGVDVLWDVPRIGVVPVRRLGDHLRRHRAAAARPGNPSETIGVPPPPLTNVPNRVGEDPHGAPRGAPQAIQLMSDFLPAERRGDQRMRLHRLLRGRLHRPLAPGIGGRAQPAPESPERTLDADRPTGTSSEAP